jgi:large subunit ribosomal protein L18
MSSDGLAHKQQKASQRRKRVRRVAKGTSERPRLSVHITNKQISAQIIDDLAGRTLVYSTSVGQKLEGSLTDKAAWIGGDIAKKAQKAKIKRVVFDRGERLYHGRMKKLAEQARSGGLEF